MAAECVSGNLCRIYVNLIMPRHAGFTVVPVVDYSHRPGLSVWQLPPLD